MEVIEFSKERSDAWDAWCAGAINSTFLHTRRFLNYHGERFRDVSAFILDRGNIAGVFPAAIKPDEPTIVVSHPGATYGGIVHQGRLVGGRMVEAFAAIRAFYSGLGFLGLRYKAIPPIYARVPAQDDLYALFRHGATRVRCDLSCTIDLNHRPPPSERRRRSLRKAQRVVTLSTDASLLNKLWTVIAQNLARKYGAMPVHTLEELTLLLTLFPQAIIVRCALLEGEVEAGVVFFNSPGVWHAQYIGASERGYEASALDAIFESAIGEAKSAGARYFDFGTSNEDGGLVLNEGLYRFKSEFGGGGIAYEFYDLEL